MKKVFVPDRKEVIVPDRKEVIPGDFSFLVDEDWRIAMIDAYQAVETVGQPGWNALRRHDTNLSFMYGIKNPILKQISSNMTVGHSGASYGIAMRNLEYIAKNGWDSYVDFSMK